MKNLKQVVTIALMCVFGLLAISCQQENIEDAPIVEEKGNDEESETSNKLDFTINKEKGENSFNLEITPLASATAFYWSVTNKVAGDKLYGISQKQVVKDVGYEPKGDVKDYYMFLHEEEINTKLSIFSPVKDNKYKSTPFELPNAITEFVLVAITKEYPNGILVTKAFRKGNNGLEEIKNEDSSVNNDEKDSEQSTELKQETDVELKFFSGLDDIKLAHSIKIVATEIEGATYSWVVDGVAYDGNKNYILWDITQGTEFCVLVKTEGSSEEIKVCKTFEWSENQAEELRALLSESTAEVKKQDLNFDIYFTKRTNSVYDFSLETTNIGNAIAYVWEVKTSTYTHRFSRSAAFLNGKISPSAVTFNWSSTQVLPQDDIEFCLTVKTIDNPEEGFKVCRTFVRNEH